MRAGSAREFWAETGKRWRAKPAATGVLLAALLALTACTTAPPARETPSPSLRLSPAALGAEIALQQRLAVSHGGRTQHADALLEIDAQALRLVLLVGPRRLLTLSWDGVELAQQRDPKLPETLSGERFIDDIQLAYWPSAVIRAALPAGWSLDDGAGQRQLQQDGVVRVAIHYSSTPHWLGRIVIERPGADYRLQIDSREVQ